MSELNTKPTQIFEWDRYIYVATVNGRLHRRSRRDSEGNWTYMGQVPVGSQFSKMVVDGDAIYVLYRDGRIGFRDNEPVVGSVAIDDWKESEAIPSGVSADLEVGAHYVYVLTSRGAIWTKKKGCIGDWELQDDPFPAPPEAPETDNNGLTVDLPGEEVSEAWEALYDWLRAIADKSKQNAKDLRGGNIADAIAGAYDLYRENYFAWRYGTSVVTSGEPFEGWPDDSSGSSDGGSEGGGDNGSSTGGSGGSSGGGDNGSSTGGSGGSEGGGGNSGSGGSEASSSESDNSGSGGSFGSSSS